MDDERDDLEPDPKLEPSVWTFDELRDMYEDDDPKLWMLLGRPK